MEYLTRDYELLGFKVKSYAILAVLIIVVATVIYMYRDDLVKLVKMDKKVTPTVTTTTTTAAPAQTTTTEQITQ